MGSDFALLPRKVLYEYAATDADATCRVFRDYVVPQLKAQNLWEYATQIEMPVAQVLLKSELLGFRMDRKKMLQTREQLSAAQEDLLKQLRDSAGSSTFNPNSDKQLRSVLFETLKFETEGVKLTNSGVLSTDKETLKFLSSKYEHPFFDALLEYRKISKVLSTYIDGFAVRLDPRDYVHAEFFPDGAVTGRITASKPALATVPHDETYGNHDVSLRDMFICEDDEQIVYVDVSGFQLRLLAIFAADEKMLSIFEEGGDPHDVTAREVFGSSYIMEDQAQCESPRDGEACQVCQGCANAREREQQRLKAKRLNFGVAFGAGVEEFSKKLELPKAQVKALSARYLQAYRGLARYKEVIPILAQREGMLVTPFGRRRRFPHVRDADPAQVAYQHRQALNFLPQGTEADIMKQNMVLIAKLFRKARLSVSTWPRNIVYDSIITVAKAKEVDRVKDSICTVMARPIPELENRRFSFNIGVGRTWRLAEQDSKHGKHELSLAPAPEKVVTRYQRLWQSLS